MAGTVPSSLDWGFSRTTTITIRGSIAGTKPATDEMYASSTYRPSSLGLCALPEADRAEIYGVPLREGTNDARGLRSQVHAGTRTEPERVEIRVQIRSAELARDEHRAGVLRAREDLRDGRRPVDLALRVAEGAPADDRVAHVLIARAGSDDALVESGRDGDGLQGRSGLVRPGDRAIAEGFGIRAPHAGGVVCG